MEKIDWCLKKIQLTEPNENLSNAFLKKAEDSLKASANLEDNPDWEIAANYYAMYFSIYSILTKIVSNVRITRVR